jgi:SAM-dependent methyltransferase
MAWASLPPFVWFLPIAAILWHALRSSTGTDGDRRWNRTQRVLALLLPLVSEVHTIDFPLDLDPTFETRWSPYYRIDYAPSNRSIRVNLIGHQAIQGAAGPTIEAAAYSLPYLFQRDSGGRNFDDVLVIVAGSGNDVSRALMWGARRVDAVEIDPVILSLGNEHHPARPYSDARVTTYLDDGRNFLRKSGDRYDLIVFALVDSLVLHSGYSNIRLESYLFTREAFSDVRARLKPGGVFVVYNYFRQGWIIGKLESLLSETFREPPLTFSFPHHPIIDSEANQKGAFTMFVAGDAGELRAAFDRFGRYCFDAAGIPSPRAHPGFLAHESGSAPPCLLPLEPTRVIADPKAVLPTDDWPFLYLREPMVPALSLRGIGVMAALSVALFASFGRAVGGGSRLAAFQPRFFFLGAGFMLIETKAVVQLALLVGSTWVVNSIVILAILLMILASVSAARRWSSVGERVLYGGLFTSLAANALIPLDVLLEVGVWLQLVLACALLATPLFFSGVIFARSFARSSNPDAALGVNLAGSMLGGFAEYGSMLLGFQALPLLAFVFYVLSIPHRDAR